MPSTPCCSCSCSFLRVVFRYRHHHHHYHLSLSLYLSLGLANANPKVSPRLQLGEVTLKQEEEEMDAESPRLKEPLPERIRRPVEPDTIGRTSFQRATKAAATTRVGVLFSH
jgi:hypothetical protein